VARGVPEYITERDQMIWEEVIWTAQEDGVKGIVGSVLDKPMALSPLNPNDSGLGLEE